MHPEVETLIWRALIWYDLQDVLDIVLVHFLHPREAQLFRLLDLHLSLEHLLFCQLSTCGLPRMHGQATSFT